MIGRRKPTPLEPWAQKMVLIELTPLAERSWDLVDDLQRGGWCSVIPRIRLEESFGREGEVPEYRNTIVELAKVSLASPNIRFRLPECGPYTSQFLDNLHRRWIDENTRCFGSDRVPIWAREAVPCLRAMEFFRYAQPADFERRLRDVVEDERSCRVREIGAHISSTSIGFRDELERPISFYRAVATREAGVMGFIFDQRRSDERYITLTRPLNEAWDLCLAPEPLAWYPGKREGDVRMLLSLQAANHHRRPIRKSRWNQVMVIEYADLVRHFDLRYLAFRSLEELEVIVKARMFLLSLTIDEIESRLLVGLAKLSRQSS